MTDKFLTDRQSKSDRIRNLAASGFSVGDIARQLGIRYQHAYNVLRAEGSGACLRQTRRAPEKPAKPPLSLRVLRDGGFERSAAWVTGADGELFLDGAISEAAGVYAFCQGDLVLYVGVANMGLKKRLYFYARPGATQTTSIRVKALLLERLGSGQEIQVFTVVPSDAVLNGMPVSGAAGLEHGLIKSFAIPWNIRGAR